MPTFVVYTNTPKGDIPDGFLLEATTFIANLLSKPESFVTVRVHPEQMISHGGSTDPCGSVELYSIGALGENNSHAKAIANFIETKLKIPPNRFYVTFVDLERNNCALDGKTFVKSDATKSGS